MLHLPLIKKEYFDAKLKYPNKNGMATYAKIVYKAAINVI